jgi:hypothetical protein
MTLAATSWPEAAIAIAGILLVTVFMTTLVWQLFVTGRTGLSARRENAYRKLAEETAEIQQKTADALESAVAELRELTARTGELERMLKEVD